MCQSCAYWKLDFIHVYMHLSFSKWKMQHKLELQFILGPWDQPESKS